MSAKKLLLKLVAAVEEAELLPTNARGNLGHCHRMPPLWDNPECGVCARCAAWMAILEWADKREAWK